jgi:hypothetical protein
VPDAAPELLGERSQRLVGARQAGRPQEDERRQRRAGEIRGLVQRRCGLDAALRLNGDAGHRLVDRQHVEHVAVAVGGAQACPGVPTIHCSTFWRVVSRGVRRRYCVERRTGES